MPIYMDRHDVSDAVTAEMVAELHQKDLHVQEKFCCRALTYWFDDKRKTAFCLVDAPNEAALQQMHDHAHGQVPHSIIEVDPAVVEAFLGRIEDPKNSEANAKLVIDEPAFRIIMMIAGDACRGLDKNTIAEEIRQYGGTVVSRSRNSMLVSFTSIGDSIQAGTCLMNKEDNAGMSIAITAGVPVDGKGRLFADCIQKAECLTDMMSGRLVLSSEASALFEADNESLEYRENVKLLRKKDEEVLLDFSSHLRLTWHNADTTVGDFNKPTGMSRSQLYRTMRELTGRSPSEIIDHYRLTRAALLLKEGDGRNIAEIAYATGYTSPSYFSKCFRKHFNTAPSTLAED